VSIKPAMMAITNKKVKISKEKLAKSIKINFSK
jgi:hypothetical protein